MSEFLTRRLRAVSGDPLTAQGLALYKAVCGKLADSVTAIDAVLPECREKSLALVALQESAMWSMQALVITQDPEAQVLDPEPVPVVIVPQPVPAVPVNP